jgi:tetratricopeptide (TPR) repeat protein
MPELRNSPPASAYPVRRWQALLPLGLVALAAAVVACGSDVDSRMAEVRALQDVGQFSASIDELREILAVAPDLPEATYRLGVALVQTGEPSRAVWALEKAAESEEYAIPASLLLASAHFGSGNYEAVVRAADRVLAIDPERVVALRLRAQGRLGAGDLEAALEDTERLIEVGPEDYGARALHATVLADIGRLAEAKEAHDLLKTMGLESGDPVIAHRACLAPARFAWDQEQDPLRAEELYDDCMERFPTNGFVISESTRFYDAIDKPEKSTLAVRAAVESAPENLSLRATLSNRLRQAGEAEEAEQVLVEAAESFRSAGAWNLLASFYRLEGDHEQALTALEKVSELSGGGSDEVRFAMADVLIDLGRLERAEEMAAALEQPTFEKLLRGRILLARGDAQGALASFEEGIRAWPNNAGARFLAGLAARELGDYDRAVSELREAVRVDNRATDAAYALARIHYERGEYQESLRFGTLAARRGGAAIPDVLVVGARALTALGEWDEARATVATLRAKDGHELTAALELARVERAASGPAAAVEAIEASGLDLDDPANGELLGAWADAQLADGRADAALQRIDEALAAHPDTAPALALRGFVLIRLGRTEEARAAFERASQIDPELARARGGLATLAAKSGDLARAVALFDEAAALEGESVHYAYSAAQLALAAGEMDDAEARLREVVRRSPGHAGARNDLAWILAERDEDLDLALVLAEEARRLDPSADVLDTLGFVRMKRGEAIAAVAALEQAVEARSDSPSIRYRLGVALLKAGDTERAREMLQTAIDAGSFPEAADARRELAKLGP